MPVQVGLEFLAGDRRQRSRPKILEYVALDELLCGSPSGSLPNPRLDSELFVLHVPAESDCGGCRGFRSRVERVQDFLALGLGFGPRTFPHSARECAYGRARFRAIVDATP